MTDTHTDRQTDRQTDTQTDKPSGEVKNMIPFFKGIITVHGYFRITIQYSLSIYTNIFKKE